MKSPLEQIPSLGEVIDQLYNIDAKLEAGRIIKAYRENGKLLASFEKTKSDIVIDAKNKNLDNSKDNSKDNILELMQDLEEVIRQLHKINSLIYVGQIVAASGCINRLIANLKRKGNTMAAKEYKEFMEKK